ncbi:MAG: dioxygenase, partial [Okeania sp. SIO3B3]|nr:dioxygenase [Okeania sp. SIO3B3]
MPTPRGITYGYRADAPFTTVLAPPKMPGTRLTITGTVFAADCETPLPNALVEVWHADTSGSYDFSEAWLLRG